MKKDVFELVNQDPNSIHTNRLFQVLKRGIEADRTFNALTNAIHIFIDINIALGLLDEKSTESKKQMVLILVT